jgi:hypothetical protein
MQILHILSFSLYICVYSFEYMQIFHIGVKAMKTETYQTSPKGRSTKADKAGLSLLRPRLIEIIGDNYVYFNEILQNIYHARRFLSWFFKIRLQKVGQIKCN